MASFLPDLQYHTCHQWSGFVSGLPVQFYWAVFRMKESPLIIPRTAGTNWNCPTQPEKDGHPLCVPAPGPSAGFTVRAGVTSVPEDHVCKGPWLFRQALGLAQCLSCHALGTTFWWESRFCRLMWRELRSLQDDSSHLCIHYTYGSSFMSFKNTDLFHSELPQVVLPAVLGASQFCC